MGRFKFIQKKHSLKIIYVLDYFEMYSLNQDRDSQFIYLEYDKKDTYITQLDGFITLSYYLQTGLTYAQLLNLLAQIAYILKYFEQSYMKLDNLILHYNQFLIDVNTKTVRFVYVNTTGNLQYINFQNLMDFIIDSVCLLTIEDARQISLLVNTKDLAHLDTIVSDQDVQTMLLVSDNSLLFQLSQGSERYTFRLKENHFITVGRSIKADLHISSQDISKEHARFVCYQNQLCLIDCGTKNGTFINQYALQPDTYYKISSNNLITFGNVSYRCEFLTED